MKVILLNEVKNLGKINDVIEVSDGYARNYLFPHNLAIAATADALKINQKIKNEQNAMAIEKVKYYQKIQKDLEILTLEFTLKANNGKVANAISTKQICAYLEHNYGIELDKHKFVSFKPIKTIGITEVTVKLYANVISKFKVKVSEK